MQCLIEEAEFSQDTLARTLPLVSFFARGCNSPENWEALSRGPYSDELIQQALVMYVKMDSPREMWVRNTVARLFALSRPVLDRLCEEGLETLQTSIASLDDKEASLALLTLCGLLVHRSEGIVEGLLPLLPQIKKSAVATSAPIVEAANWALGLIYYIGAGKGPPSHSLLDQLISAWLCETEPESVRSFALASVLVFPRGSWKPQLTRSERSKLRSYLNREERGHGPARYDSFTVGLIGFHVGDAFSDQELLTLMRGHTPETERCLALFEAAGLSGDNVKRESRSRR